MKKKFHQKFQIVEQTFFDLGGNHNFFLPNFYKTMKV
jgi:hypothetical protein